MNWNCELVMDLAPLYHDGAASEVSRRLVKKHLQECPQCRAFYKKYRSAEKIPSELPDRDAGAQYAMLAKRVRRHRLLLWGGFLAYVSATIVALVLYYVKEHK